MAGGWRVDIYARGFAREERAGYILKSVSIWPAPWATDIAVHVGAALRAQPRHVAAMRQQWSSAPANSIEL
jgi:hypothetical protein